MLYRAAYRTLVNHRSAAIRLYRVIMHMILNMLMNTIMHMIMIMGVLINMNIIMNPKKRHRTEFFPLMSGINSCACNT